METSRIDKARQAVIPDDICVALGLEPGDEIAWAIENGQVRVTRAKANEAFSPEQREWLQAEWTKGRNSGESDRTFEDIVKDVLGEHG